MRTLATWCVRHRRVVVLAWLLVLLAATGLARSVGSAYTNNFSLPNTESTRALDLLQAASPAAAGDREQVVFHTTNGVRVTDPSVRERIEPMLANLAHVPYVSEVQSPFGPLGASEVNAAGTTAFATVTFDKLAQNIPDSVAKQFVATAQKASGPGLQVAVAGQVAEQANRPSFGGTLPGVILAGIVLYLVFGSGWAMCLPLLSALASLGTAIGVIELLSHVLKMPVFSTELVLLIGLGVGVDYALFIVTRHRQGLIAGNDVESSIVNSVNTSGRAVMFAGIIVCIALLGMFALGVTFLYGLAVAAAIGVAFTMIAALTLLPAMLGFLGHRVLSRKQKRELATNGPRVVGAGTTGFWPRWADFIKARPVLPAVCALAIIVVVALPYFSLRMGLSDQGNDPTGTTTRTAYDLLANGFGPGFNGPLLLVADNEGPANVATLDRLATAVGDQHNVARVTPPVSLPSTRRTHGLAHHRLPRVIATSGVDHRPRRSLAIVNHSGGHRRVGGTGRRGWVDSWLHRLFARAHLEAPLVHRPGGSPLLPSPQCRVPKPPHPAHRRGHEPPFDRCRLRGDGGRLPMGLGRFTHRIEPGWAYRLVPTRHALRHPLRTFDGLRGLSRESHPRGVVAHG